MAIIYFPAPRTFWPPIISRSIASQYEFIKSPFLILRKVFRAQEPKTKFHITMLELFHQGQHNCTALDDIKYWYEPTKTFFFVSTQYFVDLGRARSIYICTAYNPHICWIDVRPRDHHRSFLPLLCLSSFCTFYLPRNMLLFEFVYLQKINLIKVVMEFTFGILDFYNILYPCILQNNSSPLTLPCSMIPVFGRHSFCSSMSHLY